MMTMDNSNGQNEMKKTQTLRPRRCRVRVLVNRRQRQESESDTEIILKNEGNTPSTRSRGTKRPALNLEKMMKVESLELS